MAISDTKARKAQAGEKPYRIPDGEGLYLDVRPSGKKIWRVRYFLQGKEKTFTAGQYPTVGLKEARAERDWVKATAARGLDPVEAYRLQQEAERSAREDSFATIALEWLARQELHWTPYYAGQVRKGVEEEMIPAFGAKHIDNVTAADVLKLMRSVEERGAPTVAILIRQWVGSIYQYAASTLRAEHDPSAPLRRAVKRPPIRHAQALTPDQLRTLAQSIPTKGGYRLTQIAMEVLMRTMLRTGEMRQGRWDEIHWMRAEWHVPADKMKRRRPHVVPLTTQVVALLQELHKISGGGEVMFPGLRDPRTPMAKTTINDRLRRMGWVGIFTGHGFRATASTLLNQHGWRGDVIERQLAHTPGDKVRASYNHADYLDERRLMLQWWSDYIDALIQERAAPPVPGRMSA
ncbi:tyrosine-type recombinase/integrase [Halomonas sp. HP20-15]|uniref:tyrosine-type recombinase/integrase n=1 Tax=Halomonas sp. HP20-15 TaxID=3085901 RepID=UPI0029822DBD|nr:tyrosine-type recombinase/integrase [Halomonas sp. HP20-15]MDW5376793.1 tyrosine-type recombinase/integrase [Halomonas sp. HP20-15]